MILNAIDTGLIFVSNQGIKDLFFAISHMAAFPPCDSNF